MFHPDANIPEMFWKVITGTAFGIVLGAVRYKSKNTYSPFLLQHEDRNREGISSLGLPLRISGGLIKSQGIVSC